MFLEQLKTGIQTIIIGLVIITVFCLLAFFSLFIRHKSHIGWDD